MRVLRVSHSAVVDAWRERERRPARARPPRRAGVSGRVGRGWPRRCALRARPGEPVVGARTSGSHPALFVYDPRPLWRALGEPVDVIDIHEEPFALATAEVLLLRRLRRQRAPYVLYSAQNIDKSYPPPVPLARALGAAPRRAGSASATPRPAASCERKGFPGRARRHPARHRHSRLHARRLATADASAPAGAARVVGFAGRLAPRRRASHVLVEAVAARPGPRAAHRRRRARSEAGSRRSARARRRPTGSSSSVRSTPPTCPAFYRSLDVLAVPSLTTTAGWSSSGGWRSRRWRAAPRSSSATAAPCPRSSASRARRARGRRRRRWPRRSPGSCIDARRAPTALRSAGLAARRRDLVGAGRRRPTRRCTAPRRTTARAPELGPATSSRSSSSPTASRSCSRAPSPRSPALAGS